MQCRLLLFFEFTCINNLDLFWKNNIFGEILEETNYRYVGNWMILAKFCQDFLNFSFFSLGTIIFWTELIF